MRTATIAQVRYAVARGEYDERDVEDLLCDLQEQEESRGLDFHRLDRCRPLHSDEEDL